MPEEFRKVMRYKKYRRPTGTFQIADCTCYAGETYGDHTGHIIDMDHMLKDFKATMLGIVGPLPNGGSIEVSVRWIMPGEDKK
jgi:hypothetical protein